MVDGRSVREVMGMPVGSTCATTAPPALDRAFAWLHWVDATFSTYRAESEISRLDARQARARATPRPRVRAVLARCSALRERTGGCFDAPRARRARPVGPRQGLGGRPRRLRCSSATARATCCVDAGGDVRVRGERAPGGRGASASSTPTARPHRRRPARARPRGRHLGRLRARRAHRRPADRRGARGRAVGHRPRARPGHRRRLCHGCLRHGRRTARRGPPGSATTRR